MVNFANSMNKQKISFLLVFALLTCVFITACKKDHRILGNELLPADDQLNATVLSGLAVEAFSKKYDSIVSLNSDQKFLGANNDGSTGKLEVGLYTNMSMGVTSATFATDLVLLSSEIILILDDINYIGGNQSTLTYSVFTLDSTLNYNRAYYTSNTRLHNKQKIVGAGLTNSTTVNGLPALRLPIDSDFAKELMQNTSALSSNEALQKAYKGFYIVAENTGDDGVIFQSILSNQYTGFVLKYKKSASDKDTISFRFSFSGDGAARFNTAKFTPVAALQNQFGGDSLAGANAIFLKGMGASKAKVKIPFLKNYGDTFRVAVNRAEVVFQLDDLFASTLTSGSDNVYRAPSKLCLLALDSLGREILMQDQRNGTYIGRYDGTYDASNKRYVFNIPLQAQAILNGEIKNYGFMLVIADPDPLVAAFRDAYVEGCILQGSSDLGKPAFNLSYVRLNKP